MTTSWLRSDRRALGALMAFVLLLPNAIASAAPEARSGAVVSAGSLFYPVTPCRLLDTRNPNGPLGGPKLQPGVARSFTLPPTCGVPAGAAAVSVNATVTNTTGPGQIVLFPGDIAAPGTSNLSFGNHQTRAAEVLVPLAADGSIGVLATGAAADFILDVGGYFVVSAGPGTVTLDAVPDQTIPTNTTLSLRLSGHSTDALDVLTYGLVSGPAGASVSPPGVFLFAPTQGQLGPRSMTVQVRDGGGQSAQATFQVTVIDHDHPPVMGPLPDDLTRVGASYTKVLTATDPDAGDVLTFSLLSGPAGMTLSGSTLSWTPGVTQLGNWPVRVKVTDRAGLSASGLFNVGIQFLVATDDAYQVVLGQTLTVNAPGVLANDLDPLSGPLTAAKLTNPDKGTLNSFNADGSFVYQAPAVLPGPLFDPIVKTHKDFAPGFFAWNPVIADLDGDGVPEIIVNHISASGAGITAWHLVSGTLQVMWDVDGFRYPNGCIGPGASVFEVAVGDIDDSGHPSIVFPVGCLIDNDSPARYMALNGLDGTLKWLSPPLGNARIDRVTFLPLPDNDPAGIPDGLAFGTVPTIARLRRGETPSIVVGAAFSYFDFAGKPECNQLVPGWPALTACRGAFVLDGKDGTVRQRMAAPSFAGDGTTYGNGTQPAAVADLTGQGTSDIVFGGAVFGADGAVKWNNATVAEHGLTFWNGLGNFDDDPDVEIVRLDCNGITFHPYPDRLAVFKADGRLLWSLPLPGTAYTGIPVVADVDGTGRPAVVFSVDGNVCAVDDRGNYKWCHDVGSIGGVPNLGTTTRVQVYDLDGDGIPEVIVALKNQVLLFLDGATGNVKLSFDMAAAIGPPLWSTAPDALGGPVIADVDGSGHAAIVTLWDNSTRINIVSARNNDWRPVRKIFNQASYYPGDVNDDGTIPHTFVNSFATPATNVFGNQAQVLPPVDPRLKSQTSFTYTASDGALTSAPGTVTIDIVPTNRPPAFVSTPPTRYLANSPFSYAAQAIDPDPGDTVTYSLKLAQGNGADWFVGNCTIAPSTGVLSCGILFVGEQDFVIVATDSFGASAFQNIRILESAGPAAVPNVVGQLQAAAGLTLTGAGFTTGNVTQIDNPAPAGQVVQQVPGAGAQLLLGSSVDLVVSKGPAPPPPPPGPPPGLGNIKRIVVTPASTLQVVGDNIPYKATSINNDATGADITAFVVWSSTATAVATVNAAGVAHAAAPGITILTATAGGLSGQATLSVAARAPGDSVPPTAIITQPASGGTVTGLTQILGTATDAHFLRYELAIEASGDTTFNLIGQGTTQVTNGVLGTLDPTLLLNGAYTLRLTVFDANGNTATADVPFVADGYQKVGNFMLAYTDLTVPLAGLPIQITRLYDSRDKSTGDFGVGWRLGIKALRISTSKVLGASWQVIQQGTNFGLVPGSDRFVSVTLPNGKVETFDLHISPTSSFLVPFTTLFATFVPRQGTLGRLQSLENVNLLIVDPQPGPVTLLDDSLLTTFNPDRYLYTQLDGTQVVVTRTHGVESIKDTNGNQITITPGGISHTSGAAVIFTRDANGRITSITDPSGKIQTYVISPAGDLASRTDAAGNTTSYFYNAQHGVVRVVDPLGNQAARTEYDDQGRLLSITDAAGHTTKYNPDLPGRQEQIEDVLGNITVFNYDERGNVLTRTDPLGHQTTFTYDDLNNQLTQTDPLGRLASRTYDGQNNVLSASDFEGNTSTFTYDAKGHVLTVIDPEGHTKTNVYDAAGNLTQVTDPEGGVTNHTYDTAGNRLSTTDPLGHITTFTYDASGHATSKTDPLGNTKTYTYDANGRVLDETDAPGNTTHRAYDSTGRITSVTDALGNVILITYSNQGDGQKIASRTDTMGQVTRLDYDLLGNLTKTTFPDGAVETATYDAMSHVLSKTDRDLHTGSFQYDALGRQTGITHPDGTSTSRTFDAVGRVLTQTDERGNTTTYGYPPNQQMVTDALANVTVHRFDGLQHRIQTTDALGRVTSFTYDSAGNPTTTTFPDGTSKTTTWDAAKRKTRETDQAGRSTQFTLDAAGQLLSVTDAAGGVTSYTYDALGNRLTQTDSNGHTTQMAYDALGRLVSRTRPSGKQETFSYDARGNQVGHTDFNGQTTTFVYDSLNRQTQKILPGGAVVTYAYTPGGLRSQAGGDRYTFDTRGRLVRELKASAETLVYTYDAAGNKTSVATSLGTTTYSYDALNRLATVADASGTSTYGYDTVGNLASTALPNGVSTNYSYDTLNRLVKVNNSGPSGLISSYTYTLGLAGNRVHVSEAGPATTGRSVAFAYDAVYRLTQEQITESPNPLVTIGYTYDTAGNRTQMNRNGAVTTYAYDVDDRVLTESSGAGTITSAFDDNGNLTSRSNGSSNVVYSYDAENRMLGATDPSGAVTYTYDADGMRTSKTAGSFTTTFLLDKASGMARVLVEKLGATAATYTYGHQLISQVRTFEGVHFYLADGQLSTRQLTDGLGVVSDAYTYDAFGVQLTSSGSTTNDFRYTGEQFDPNVGFYYLRARYYSQSNGRFISTDPHDGDIFDPVSLHRYLYANSSPLDMRDPSGRSTLSEIMVITAIGGGIGAAANLAGLGVKAWLGGTVTFADVGRAAVTGFLFGAAGAGLAEAAIGAAAAYAGFVILNTANTIFLKHKSDDVSLRDIWLETILNTVASGFTVAADQVFAGIASKINSTLGTGSVSGSVNKFVDAGSADNLIVWRHVDKCPTNKWYKKGADNKYVEADTVPYYSGNVSYYGCNVIGPIVDFFDYEFSLTTTGWSR